MNLPEVDVDLGLEENSRKRLEALLTAKGWSEPNRNVEIYFSFDGPHARLQFFRPRVPKSGRERLLVSGAGLGSEMLVARAWGFDEIVGTEIEEGFVELIRDRLDGREGFDVVHTSGVELPFPDGHFSSVGFSPDFADTSKKADHVAGGVSWRAEGSFQTNTSERPFDWRPSLG